VSSVLSAPAHNGITWLTSDGRRYEFVNEGVELASFEAVLSRLGSLKGMKGRLQGAPWTLSGGGAFMRRTMVFKFDAQEEPAAVFRMLPWGRYSLESPSGRRYGWRATVWVSDLKLLNQDGDVVVKQTLQWIDSGRYSVRTTVTDLGTREPDVDWLIFLSIFFRWFSAGIKSSVIVA